MVARSTAKAEFWSMAHGICELLWIKIILTNLKVKWEWTMRLYYVAISIAHNPVQHDHTKHIEVNRHFIKENLDSELVCTPYISTKNQLAYILTKALTTHLFSNITSKLVMKNIYSPTWRRVLENINNL